MSSIQYYISTKSIKKIFVLLAFFATVSVFSKSDIRVGAYLDNIENINFESNTYNLRFQIWYKWKGSFDPNEDVLFTNMVDHWGLSYLPLAAVQYLPDSVKYQRFYVEGVFNHKFWVGSYPMDWQKVLCEVEFKDPSKYNWKPVKEEWGYEKEMRIPGLDIVETIFEIKEREPINMGLTNNVVQHAFRFGAKVQRPSNFLIMKIFPPILITFICALLVFFLHVSYVDARTSTGFTALLTLVFLHLSVTDGLPNVGIVLLIDYLFNYSYLLILLLIGICIYTTRLYDQIDQEVLTEDEEIELQEARIKKIDRISVAGLFVFSLIGYYVIVQVYLA